MIVDSEQLCYLVVSSILTLGKMANSTPTSLLCTSVISKIFLTISFLIEEHKVNTMIA